MVEIQSTLLKYIAKRKERKKEKERGINSREQGRYVFKLGKMD